MELSKIAEPCPEWQGAAWRGVHRGADAWFLLGSEGATSQALEGARRSAVAALAGAYPGVLPLRDVILKDDRIAWVYDSFGGASLQHTLTNEESLLPLRVAAELVAEVAEILEGMHRDEASHPGPEAADVLVDAAGCVVLAGWGSPFPVAPAYVAPRGETGESAITWRMGILLSHLVSGVAPSSGRDPGAHEGVVRRTLIRAMSRPGAVMGERYSDWIRGLLAWKTENRPPLSTVASGLRQVAEKTAGPTLNEWAARHVPRMVESARAGDPRIGLDSGRGRFFADQEEAYSITRVRGGTLETPTAAEVRVSAPSSVNLLDEPTLETGILWNKPSHPAQRAPGDLEAMPVSVGPPPEALPSREAWKLPRGFLDATGEHPARRDAVSEARGWSNVILVLVCLILGTMVVGLLFYLFLPIS